MTKAEAVTEGRRRVAALVAAAAAVAEREVMAAAAIVRRSATGYGVLLFRFVGCAWSVVVVGGFSAVFFPPIL